MLRQPIDASSLSSATGARPHPVVLLRARYHAWIAQEKSPLLPAANTSSSSAGYGCTPSKMVSLTVSLYEPPHSWHVVYRCIIHHYHAAGSWISLTFR